MTCLVPMLLDTTFSPARKGLEVFVISVSLYYLTRHLLSTVMLRSVEHSHLCNISPAIARISHRLQPLFSGNVVSLGELMKGICTHSAGVQGVLVLDFFAGGAMGEDPVILGSSPAPDGPAVAADMMCAGVLEPVARGLLLRGGFGETVSCLTVLSKVG